jgi:hypothetical protein
MTLFKKIEEQQIGSSPITLGVLEADDGLIVGRVTAHGNGEIFSTLPYDPPIEDAISIASRFATLNNVPVAVYDPENKWQPSWGLLD